jgi:hypothetical protein
MNLRCRRVGLLLALALAALFAAPAASASPPKVTIALLPQGTSVAELARVPRLAPGVLSAGLGDVPAAQTYLDAGQGNRVFDSLYDGDLPPIGRPVGRVPNWEEIVERADSAPADIVPGLLASTLRSAGLGSAGGTPVTISPALAAPTLMAADRDGHLAALTECSSQPCLLPVRILATTPATLAAGVEALRGRDLLIALARPPPGEDDQLAIGIAGRGFDGNLTSDSTRLEGYVLSTDLAPTILGRLGVGVPDEMSGEPIRSEGDRDAEAVLELERRMGEIGPRRGPVIGLSVLVWLALAVLAGLALRDRAARVAVELLALTVIYMPALLLLTSGLRPSEAVERLLVLLGAPALGALTLWLLRGYRALAVACAVTTLAYAIDVLAGSPLTSLSLMGPNPGLGVRFYGIGNELEALLAPLVLLGAGAALAGFVPRLDGSRAALCFGAVAAVAAVIFAAGRFGADVGAAIVLPAGAAVAAVLLAQARRRALLIAAAPILALAGLAGLDLALGGDSHLTRSVLDAGGLHDLADVAERRLRLSARSFGRASSLPFLALAAILVALGIWQRRRLLDWLSPHPEMRAGFLGAAAATAVGTLVNDSGALLLEIGVGYLLLAAGYAWAQASASVAKPTPTGGVRD